MKMIFVDSDVVIAYNLIEDEQHQKAIKVFERISAGNYGDMVISEYNIIEVATVIGLKESYSKSIEVCEILMDAKEVKIVKGDLIFSDSWKEFKLHRNLKLSFIDASNLVAMRQLGIDSIATFDKKFKRIEGIKVIDK